MLTAQQAFRQSAASMPPLPLPPELKALWSFGGGAGVIPRQGQFITISGRSGSQKSGFALFWVRKMGLPALYISGDMTPFEATSRLAGMETGHTQADIEQWWSDPIEGQVYTAALQDSNISFSFGNPITEDALIGELNAWVEIHNSYPEIVVIDNLMDMEGCAEEDNSALRGAMSYLYGLVMDTGCTVILISHATDKSDRGESLPGMPASRREVKGGIAEKPQIMLSVALDPDTLEFRVAVIKNRNGPQDPSAKTYAILQAYPEVTRFGEVHRVIPHWNVKEIA